MITSILYIISMGWFLTQLSDFTDELMQVLKKPKKVLQIPSKMLMCMKCASFWLALALTLNFPFACACAMIAYIIDKYLISTPIAL